MKGMRHAAVSFVARLYGSHKLVPPWA